MNQDNIEIERKNLIKHLQPLIEEYCKGGTIVDLGVGHKNYFKDILYNISKTKNKDINLAAMDLFLWPGSVNFVGDSHFLPIKNDSIDFIIFVEVLEHLRYPHKAASEICRILKPGGIVVGSTRFLFPVHKAPWDYFRFTKDGLEVVFEKFIKLKILPDNGQIKTLERLFYIDGIRGFWQISKIFRVILRFLLKFDNITNEKLTQGWLFVFQKGNK